MALGFEMHIHYIGPYSLEVIKDESWIQQCQPHLIIENRMRHQRGSQLWEPFWHPWFVLNMVVRSPDIHFHLQTSSVHKHWPCGRSWQVEAREVNRMNSNLSLSKPVDALLIRAIRVSTGGWPRGQVDGPPFVMADAPPPPIRVVVVPYWIV